MDTAFPQAPRKVLARPRKGGLFTKGNHFSGNTGRTTHIATDFQARGSGFYGVNSALPVEGYKGPFKKAKPAPKRGRVCRGCGIETPLSGKCNQCWD